MSILLSLIKKETLHLLRDVRTMTIVLVMPLILLILFGFAISTEVNNIRVAVVVNQHTDTTRQLVEKLNANSYFTFDGFIAPDDMDPMLRRGKIDAAIIVNTDCGRTRYQIIVDASNTNTAQTAAAYLQSVISGRTPTVNTRILYNPQLKSAYNFVPGIMGMIFILICAMMTSVSIVSEKETGTMDLLLVSPAEPGMIILGKMIPYLLLSCILLALMLLLSYTVLDIPLSASIVWVVGITLVYISLALALGLLTSTLVSTQVAALLVSGVLFMIPVIMLSGMIFPIDNMPVVLQWVSSIIPARWYISAMRTLMIQQLPVTYVLTEIIILAFMTIAMITLAIKNFNKKH